MIDTVQRIYDFLVSSDSYGFSSAVGTRIWSPVAPADFTNATAAVIYHIATEASHKSSATHSSLFTFKCCGGVSISSDPFTSARMLYRYLHDKLHGRASLGNKILEAVQVNTAQSIVDPETGWPYMTATYRIIFNN